MFIVGQPFKIKKIRIPLTEQLQAGQYSLTVKVRTDNFDSTHTILSAVSTGYDGKKVLILRPQNVSGENDFVLHIETETSYFGFAMPIIIEYETYDD